MSQPHANPGGMMIRAVRPDDRARIAEAFGALHPRSVYQRFFFPKRKLTDSELQWVTEPDGRRNVVLVATMCGGSHETVIALGQYARNGSSAEIGFAVAEDYRGRGIAGRLLRELIDIARDSGVVQFEADVLADNVAMLKVFRRGGVPVWESEAAGIVHVTMSLAEDSGATRSAVSWRCLFQQKAGLLRALGAWLSRLSGIASLLGVLLLAGCSTFHPWVNPPAQGDTDLARTARTEERPVLVAVTLSGGGARAAAFGLGVLRELKATEFTLQGKPTTLLDQVALVSGVSGGSILAAHFAAFGDDSLTRFESEYLLQDFEGHLIQLALSPIRLFRLSSPWYGRSHVLAERLETLYRGLTYADLLNRERGPDLLVTATDLTTGASFEFTREQFALICSDLAAVPLSFAVAASSAVPIVLTPMTLRNHAGHCSVPEDALPAPLENSYRTRLIRSTAESYLRSVERPYIHLVDGGLADNLGVRTIMDRLLVAGSISGSLRRAPPGSIRKIVLIAVNSERELVESIDRSDRVPSIPQVIDALVYGAGARLTQITLGMMEDDMRRWRREVFEQRGTQGSPFAADAELHVVSVSLHNVEDGDTRRGVLSIPTAFTIRSEEVRKLVQAGREVLRASPEFQRLLLGLRNQAHGGRVVQGAAGVD
ncbi:MAG: hypothetical protein BroJett031_19180 [Betaproteobacteria bacterium]|nr:MAG: hypothetical protein BroJett031_19180 [Betaproteobacteria bacterium]